METRAVKKNKSPLEGPEMPHGILARLGRAARCDSENTQDGGCLTCRSHAIGVGVWASMGYGQVGHEGG